MESEMCAEDRLGDEIRALVEHVAGASRTPPQAGPETRLTEGYWLDSVELLELMIACEAKFDVVFDERRDFENGALETLGSLTDLVRSKLAFPRDSP
jgi:acyl carrier protein